MNPPTPTTETGIVEPCPFCGEEQLKPCQTQNVHWVVCPRCDAEGPIKKSAAEAIAAWNARAAMPDTDIEAETYRQMHSTVLELGYPSILEALEDLERLKARPASTQILQTMAGALEQIESGAKLGSELFKARIEERKDRLTWYAVNVLQHNLDACQGTAEIALAQFRAQEQRS